MQLSGKAKPGFPLENEGCTPRRPSYVRDIRDAALAAAKYSSAGEAHCCYAAAQHAAYQSAVSHGLPTSGTRIACVRAGIVRTVVNINDKPPIEGVGCRFNNKTFFIPGVRTCKQLHVCFGRQLHETLR